MNDLVRTPHRPSWTARDAYGAGLVRRCGELIDRAERSGNQRETNRLMAEVDLVMDEIVVRKRLTEPEMGGEYPQGGGAAIVYRQPW